MRSHRLARLGTLGVALLTALASAAVAGAADPLELVQTIPLKGKPGNLDHIAIDLQRNRLFVANKANNTMDIVDLAKGELFKQVPGQQAIQGIAYAPDLDRVYVGLGGKGLFNVFDGKSYHLIKTIKFPDDSDNVRYDPNKHAVYVAHAESSLAAVDVSNYSYKDVKLPGDAEGFTLQPDGAMLYVAVPKPSQVAVIDTDKKDVTGNYPIKAAEDATAIGLDAANHRLFVGCRNPGMLVVLDSGSGKEVATLPIPGEVDDLFYDAKRRLIYISCGEGALVVVRQNGADQYENVAKIDTAKGAKTSLFVPEQGKLYLAVPRQEGKPGPEIRVYQVH